MRIFICDRYGKRVPDADIRKVKVLDGNQGEKIFELCPSCINDINRTLDNPPPEKR